MQTIEIQVLEFTCPIYHKGELLFIGGKLEPMPTIGELYEPGTLSVSRSPIAWGKRATTGEIYEIKSRQGIAARFANLDSLDANVRSEVKGWADSQGYLCNDVATPKLTAYLCTGLLPCNDPTHADEAAAIAWAKTVANQDNWQGVWFTSAWDPNDPKPTRGGIFRGYEDNFLFRMVDLSCDPVYLPNPELVKVKF